MDGWVVYSDNQGSGYIVTEKKALDEIRREGVTINGSKIKPGQHTSIQGYFSRPLEYLGLIGENEMLFRIGEQSDLFGTKIYLQSVFRISESRLFEMFSHNSGRDFIFVNGKWK